MDEKRLTRYRKKISVVTKRENNISSWINDDDEKSILAVYKAYQELVEGLTDIFAMILKDMGELVEDDYSNIERLNEIGLLSKEQEELMKEANGLRNRLVHEYNGLEKKTALNSVKRLNPEFEDVLEEVRGWLKEQ